MTSNEQYREQLKLEIHSLLCAEKNPITPAKLHRNYREMMSTYICWVRLGFRNLDDLLKSMTDVVQCTYENGILMVKAIRKEESAHINELVAGQKSAKTCSKKTFMQHNFNQPLYSQNNNRLPNGLLPTPAHLNHMSNQRNFNRNFQNNIQLLHSMASQENRQPYFYQSNIPNQQAVSGNTNEPEQRQKHNIQLNGQRVEEEALQVVQSPPSSQLNQQPQQLEQPRPESVAENRPKPVFDVEKLKKVMMQKVMVSQETSTEPVYQRDQETQTTESSSFKVNCLGSLSSRFTQLSINHQETREVLSRASTEPSVSLPNLSYTTSPTRSHGSHLTSISRLGDTTYVRVIPTELQMLNRSFQSNVSTLSAQKPPQKKRDETHLEHLRNLSTSGFIGRISIRHLRLPNGRYRAFVLVDGMEFSNDPIDFVDYMDAYEEAARRACLYFESRFG